LYGAIQLIGQPLRARYQPPDEVPSDMIRLLTQLNESTEPELLLPSKTDLTQALEFLFSRDAMDQ
jgi:hypothetical protein